MRHIKTKMRRKALQRELELTLQELRRNESEFEMAADPYYVEQLIFQHAALMCRCRAILRELRGEETVCPSG